MKIILSMKRIFSIILCCFLILGCIPLSAYADTASDYNKMITNSTTYTAEAGKNIKVAGDGVVANITLQGVTIDKSSEVSVSAIRVENGATVKLTVKGENTLRSASGCAGISVDETSTLIIEEASTGTLNVYGGLMAAGIGGDAQKSNGTVTINGGTINAYGGDNAGEFADDRGGAGIGGGNIGSGGKITINNGTVYGKGGSHSAGIGGGNGGAAGTIVINNGTVKTYSGYQGASIGGRDGSVEINGGDVNASGWAYGAAIGCDAYGSNVAITITGGKVYAKSSSFCSAIGGSYSGTASDIVISGGEITAEGESCGIGSATSITISGGEINATAKAGGTGIESSDITITDGVIKAVGGSDGAGIGGSSGTINISGGTITAIGGYNGAGIGGRSGSSGGTITITGGSIKATPGSEAAQAVGSGANATETIVTNGAENGNLSVKLVKVESVINSNHTNCVEVTATVRGGANSYEYKYVGKGHPDDSSIYLYLPDNYEINVVTISDTLFDRATGIFAEVEKEDTNATLSIKEVDKKDIGVDIVYIGKFIAAYDITLIKNNTETQPQNIVKIRIPCTDSNAKVYRMNTDGSLTDMKAVFENDYLVFTTDHISVYIIAIKDSNSIGDVDGDGVVNISDATMVQKYVAELVTLTPEQLIAADTNGDGEININDATQIQKFIAELIDHLG